MHTAASRTARTMMSKHDLPGETREGLTAFESRFRAEEEGGGIPVGGWGWSPNRRRGGDIYTPEDRGRWINKDPARTRNRARSDLVSRSPSSRLRIPSLARLLLFMYYILDPI
jgi:hypothetical protein